MRQPYGRGRHGGRVAQVGLDALDVETVEIGVGHAGLEQRHDVGPAAEQGARDRGADEAARARDEHPVARLDRHRAARRQAARGPRVLRTAPVRSALLASVLPNSNRSAELRWASASTSSRAPTK